MKYLLVCLFVGFAGRECLAQATLPDTAFITDAVKNTIRVYENYLEGQQLFYSGSLYSEPARTNQTHAFFLNNEWMPESITFDGQLFRNVPVMYDITSDELITESVTGNPQILPRDRISNFSLMGRYFEKIRNSDYESSLPRSGFFEVLYDGKTKVICLRQKFVQEKMEHNKIERDFYEKSKYFVLINGKFFQIKSKRSLLQLLEDRKTELRAFVKKNKNAFKNYPEVSLATISKEYDLLTAGKK